MFEGNSSPPGSGRPDSPQPLPPDSGSPPLPRDFRKRPIEERRQLLHEALSAKSKIPLAGARDTTLFAGETSLNQDIEWADAMVESAVGFLGVPLGIATGFLIDGFLFHIPMAVEEPSVIAAATYAGSVISRDGGFQTWATEPEMVSQIYLEGVPEGREAEILAHRQAIQREVEPLLTSMRERGGGFRDLRVTRLAGLGLVRVDLL
ncbi:MAG TPA: hypothetical protein VMW69_13090, partial [Spirochaetia bacterium]|nr:hypothetical protein [Spirochaetia bacterium]